MSAVKSFKASWTMKVSEKERGEERSGEEKRRVVKRRKEREEKREKSCVVERMMEMCKQVVCVCSSFRKDKKRSQKAECLREKRDTRTETGELEMTHVKRIG